MSIDCPFLLLKIAPFVRRKKGDDVKLPRLKFSFLYTPVHQERKKQALRKQALRNRPFPHPCTIFAQLSVSVHFLLFSHFPLFPPWRLSTALNFSYFRISRIFQISLARAHNFFI